MRKTLISALAASSLTVGIAATAAQAGGSDPATPPTTIPGLDGIGIPGLDPEQAQCFIDGVSTVDMSDLDSAMDLLTQCGIDPMDLLAAADPGTDTAVDPVVGTETSEVGKAELDPVAVAAVLDALGVDATSLECIDNGLAASAPGDDDAALGVLQACGLSLSDLLGAIVGLGDTASGEPSTPPTPPASLVEGSTDTIAADNALVAQVQEMLAQQGVEQIGRAHV